ncbi:PP2C family protein-serine/threonine phosphatase [Paenibacillus sp. MMS18-CY102]|uniref:PP2C family protein-serine/threonine phosphatase n=1 Tax=Paenibacillus sp. MMS18-CY102 TaxID=2682849 RepID=UPI001365D555|nr:protein phosphatase 2C domain-containing protein [Paenibacillus sp. MMS18-CY102]MWC31333.1 SpoIIE family protein phosphatase [Paenibacillus sp. MMS18-CY102]
MNQLANGAWTPYYIMLAFAAGILLLLLIRAKIRSFDFPAKARSRVTIGNGQTIGARSEQDDYFASAETPVGTIAVLADGISGLDHGRMSSMMAVSTFIKRFMAMEPGEDVPAFLTTAAKQANREILRELAGARGGTTLVTALIDGDLLYWGAVGDSVLVIYRDKSFLPVNRKHTLELLLEKRVLSGELTKEAAMEDPRRNQLVNYLGYELFDNMDIGDAPFQLRRGDKVLLMSDGIYNALSEIEMEDILNDSATPDEAAEQMIERIENKRIRHQDNATIIIVEPSI